ncbi:cell division protein FtsQ/DivIB [Ovoidimarina sediminis]|uniref:cell division protein FtsQ/DivIB n=1 Tax=Ovoidimarina sediminis TaxID=3079856 RepID=UPI002908B580|nr:cell division protein FtsQ/DivIB [Rhodophyticola sp. MJ-SS7]MDU8943100.1 cell division protein FtsQ/DivIB [Rhodophyticola sp. MJ-SS7]
MRPLKRPSDPAPSRSAYKLQRLMLTPGVRIFLRWGLPVACIAFTAGIWASDADRREALIEGAAEMRREIQQRPEFMVNLMSIEGASDEVQADLREILPIDFPLSSFDLDLEAIRARAEEIDAIAEASVRVRAGGILEIIVSERIPAVVWRSRDGLELLDEHGHRVAGLATRSDRPDLPLLAGDGAETAVPEALALMEAAAPLSDRMRGLLRVGERRWDVVLDRNQRILLPEANPVPALERVIALDEVRDLLARDLTVIDMRTPERPTLRMGEAASETFRETRFSGSQ